jgi:hypothetical protein
MKALLLILLLPLIVLPQCNLTLKQSPTVRGLKLGMPGKELKLANTYLLGDVSDVPSYEGVNWLHIETHPNGRISKLEFEYDLKTNWPSNKAFAKNLSQNLGLPYKAWRFPDTLSAHMQCKGFKVVAHILFNKLELIDTSPDTFRP